MKISPSELKEYFKSNGVYSMSMDACSRALLYIKEGRVSQFIFDFHIEKLQLLVNLLEDKEEFELLASIRDKVKVHNKLIEGNLSMKKVEYKKVTKEKFDGLKSKYDGDNEKTDFVISGDRYYVNKNLINNE